MFISQTSFIVRYAETDQMGVVHHSNYAVWFEAGRTDFIRKMGLPYSKIEENGAMLPLLIVKTSIKDCTGTRLLFHYEVFKAGSDKPITEGETMHCWTDSSLKPVNIKKFRPEIFDMIGEATQRRQ